MILAMNPDDMEITTRKLVVLFPQGFQDAAEKGTTCAGLWLAAQGIRTQVLSDVQANEGLNSQIKATCKRNKRILLPLLSARICMRAQIGISGTEQKSVKFSHIKDRCGKLLEELRDCAVDGRRLMSDQERFTTPAPAAIPSDKVLNACSALADPEEGVRTEAFKWSSLRTIMVGRFITQLSATECYSVGTEALTVGSKVYFASDKNYSMRFFTCWQLLDEVSPEATRCRIGVNVPFEHPSSADLMIAVFNAHFADREEGSGHAPGSIGFHRHKVTNMRQLMHHGGRFVAEIVLKPTSSLSIPRDTPKILKRAAKAAKKKGKDIWTALEECLGPEIPRGPSGSGATAGGHGGPAADSPSGADASEDGAHAAEGDDGADGDEDDAETIAPDDELLEALAESILKQSSGAMEEMEESFDDIRAADAAEIDEELFAQCELDKLAAARLATRKENKGEGGSAASGSSGPDQHEFEDDVADIPAEDRDQLLAELAFDPAASAGAEHARSEENVEPLDPGVFKLWLSKCEYSISAIRAAIDEAKPPGFRSDSRSPPQLSLVSGLLAVPDHGIERRQIFYMAWRDGGKLDGRKCEIGRGTSAGTIKYSVTLNPAKVWPKESLFVLHSAIGAAMEKTTYQRPTVPAPVLHLEMMLGRALAIYQDGVSAEFGWGQHEMKDSCNIPDFSLTTHYEFQSRQQCATTESQMSFNLTPLTL